MIIIGALIGYPIFIWLLDSSSQLLANSFTFVSPMISLIMGTIILNESITLFTMYIEIMIVVSVMMIIVFYTRYTKIIRKSLE